MNRISQLLPLFFLACFLTGCGGEEAATPPDQEANQGAMQGAPPGEVTQAEIENGVQVVHITVDASGYEPDRIQLQAGVPARLVFNRTVEGECAEQVQIPEFGIAATDLPLNQEHAIEFTPSEAGEFTFACGMDMMEGTLVVRS